MTTADLTKYFNDTFGLNEWPKTFEVDHETYANVVQSIFNNKAHKGDVFRLGNDKRLFYRYEIDTGTKHNGILFKNVELVLKSK